MMAPLYPPWTHEQVIANGIRLHCVVAGPLGAPLVVLLHGFPDGWYTWRHQMGALACAGLRVVAPDLRGYGCSEKPPGIAAYAVEHLVEDVAGIVRAFGAGRRAAAVIGHDWGGGIAWSFGAVHGALAERLVVVNCPHGAALKRSWLRPRQIARSWYILFLQVPLLPELILRAGRLRFVDAAFGPARRRNPRAVTEQDVARVRRELARPGTLTAAINYYRALARRPLLRDDPFTRPAALPTLVVWGERDPYLGAELLATASQWATDVKVERLPDLGHFCHQERPRLVNNLLLHWIATAV
jgi:pimeloyl-ACP methyl ester carboxylesterase